MMSPIKYVCSIYFFLILIQEVKLYMIPLNKLGKKCVKNQYDFLGIYDLYSQKNDEKSVVDRLKGVTECFNLEVFYDCENCVSLPFEEYIDKTEYFLIDFVKFYFGYINSVINAIYNRRLVNFILNPGSVLIVFMYLFYLKSFRPMKLRIETELKSAASCSSADTFNK